MAPTTLTDFSPAAVRAHLTEIRDATISALQGRVEARVLDAYNSVINSALDLIVMEAQKVITMSTAGTSNGEEVDKERAQLKVMIEKFEFKTGQHRMPCDGNCAEKHFPVCW